MVFDWLKHIMPRGLYGRAALILFLPIVVVTLVVSIMFLQRHFEDVTQQMAAAAAAELTLVAERIAAHDDPGAALQAGAGVAHPLGLTVQLPPAPGLADRRAFYDLSGRVVIAELHAIVPNVQAVDLSNRRAVQVLVAGPHPFSLTIPRRRLTASNPHQLLVLMLGTSLMMTAIASVFLRNQLRPIRRLALAAEAYGRGRVEPYRPAGAVEVRSAGTAFLDMRNRIERQNEQRKMMLSGISHDLRTPLTRLRLGLSMMTPDMPPDPAEIADMERDVAEMGAMIDAFLEHARDEAQDGGVEHVPALPFVRDIIATAQRGGQAVSAGRMSSDTGDSDGRIAVRPLALRRAVENLIGNAVRYGSRAQVEAALTARSFRVTVDDDGPGIPFDRRDDALRPFVRLDAARNQDRGQGAGLGLSIAAEIARAHGGQLRLADSPMGGLRAEIVLPR